MKTFSVILASASLAAMLVGGCFSYHSTKEYTPAAQVPPAAPPGETTTTTTTQSNDGTVRQHSSTTYAP